MIQPHCIRNIKYAVNILLFLLNLPGQISMLCYEWSFNIQLLDFIGAKSRNVLSLFENENNL